jgi:hypothetical protein
MSAVANQVTKFQMTAAATVIAAAAVLTPAAVAAAKPDFMPAAPVTQFTTQFAQDIPFWWFDDNSPVPNQLFALGPLAPTATTIFSFTPLLLLPPFIRPLFGWFNLINIGVCVAGLGVSIGPYGTISVKSGAC